MDRPQRPGARRDAMSDTPVAPRTRARVREAAARHLGWIDRPPVQRAVAFAIDEVVASHVRWRGDLHGADGRLTLLTVNWNTEPMLDRLLRSFRRFVNIDLPVVVIGRAAVLGCSEDR